MNSPFKLAPRIGNDIGGSRIPQRILPSIPHQNLSNFRPITVDPHPGKTLLLRPQIVQVDVEQKIAEIQGAASAAVKLEKTLEHKRIEAQTSRSRTVMGTLAAGSLAALAITLIPKVAYAGSLGSTLLSLASNPLGLAVLVGAGLTTLAFYVKYMFGFDKTMDARNANPGDSTLRKQLAVFSMIPLTILGGSGLLYLGACFLPWGAAPTFFILAGGGLIYGAYKFVRSVIQTVKANRQTISPGYKTNLRQIIGTNLSSHLVQGAEAAYAFYRGATLFELIAGVVSYTVYGAVAATSLASLGTGALAIGLPLAVLTTAYLRFTSKKWNELQHEFGRRFDLSSARGIRNVALAIGSSLAAGALLWNFHAPLINLGLALAFFFTEVHALVHNWSCQGGSREIIQTPPEEYSDSSVWGAARRPNSPWISVMKPGFDANDFIVPTYALLYLRKGVNWDFNIISGINLGMAGAFKDTHETLKFLRRKEQLILHIISVYERRIHAAATLAGRYVELANLYEALALRWENESRGNFSSLTVTKDYARKRNAFSSPDANEFEKYLGECIRWEATKFRDQAQRLRARPTASLSQAEINEHLDAFKKQYGLIFHWFPPKQFRNICPDVIKSKIREIDLFNQLIRTFKTGASILRKNRHTGEYYWEILPCSRIRKLDPHTNTLSWVTRSNDEIDNTESYSDIRDVDNTGMTDPTGPAHSRKAYTYGPMGLNDKQVINFKDGTHLTFTAARGPSAAAQLATHPDRDPVVWVPGMLIDPALEAALPKDWKDKKGKINDVFKPALFHFFESRYQTMCDGEHADIITSDFLAPLEKDLKDSYVLGLWKVPEKVEVPNAEHLKERDDDRLVRISPSYANFMLRVKEADTGKVLYIPYNWMKNTKIKGDVWSNIHRIELMSRDDFRARFGVEPRDGHGDKFENVIVPFDQNGNRIRLITRGQFKNPIASLIWEKLIGKKYVKEVGDGTGFIQPSLDAAIREDAITLNFSRKELDHALAEFAKSELKRLIAELVEGKLTEENIRKLNDAFRGIITKARDTLQRNAQNDDELKALIKNVIENRSTYKQLKALPGVLSKVLIEFKTKLELAKASGEEMAEKEIEKTIPEVLKKIRTEELKESISAEEFKKSVDELHAKEVPEILKKIPDILKTSAKSAEVLPYSYFLKDPKEYESPEIDRGLGRIGDMNFVAYTYERENKTRYMRWLPRDKDWPELDFEERNERIDIRAGKIILHTCRWIGKRFAYDRHRLMLDTGSHEHPNFEVTEIKGPEQFLRSIGAIGRFVFAVKDAAGRITYRPFTGRSNNSETVVDQRINGSNLELFHITQDDKRVLELGHDQNLLNGQPLNYPSTWINSVSINLHPTDRNQARIEIRFVNPFTGAAMGTQDIDIQRGLLPNLSSIYRNGNNEAYIPKIFDQRQKNPKTGEIENRLFLTFYTCKTETIRYGLTLNPRDEIRLIEVKSSLRIRHLNSANGLAAGTEEWVPFDQAMPKATKSQIWFDAKNKPFSSGLAFGRVDTMIAPQHLVPVRKGVGPEWADDDQKFYFGEVYDESGEYNWNAGWVRNEKRPATWSKGPFSLQYAKSIRGAALNTGSNTVMRAPHEDLLFGREELEVYAEGGMPVPLYKSLFDKSTTTEDAQGAWEKRRIFNMETRMDRTVRSVGASVNNVGEGNGQRGRWAAMLLFIQRIPKIFFDEFIRARLLHQIPSHQYTNKQLHEWFNTFTWYLDTIFKHVVPLIPFVYMLGLSPLPAGAIVFPLLWAIKTVTGWPKYSSDNQKMGVSRRRSYFKNLALNYLYIPNISRNTSHIFDEAKGPFVSTAGIGGRTFYPWAVRRIVCYFGGLSGITTAVGIYRLIAYGMFSMTYFGLVMNVIWPAIMFAGVTYALRMVWNEMKYKFDSSDLTDPKSYANNFKNRKTGRPSKARMFLEEFVKPVSTDWIKEVGMSLKRFYRYHRYGEY